MRIGLHTGEAIKEGDDFFGKHVILAARIAGQAEGGEILASSLLKELTASAGDIAFGEGARGGAEGPVGLAPTCSRWRGRRRPRIDTTKSIRSGSS